MEKKIMWIVERDLKISKVLAVYDNVRQKVVTYYFLDGEYDPEDDAVDWNSVDEREPFFNSVMEANDYRCKRKREIKAMFKEVKEFIELMEDFRRADDFKFERTDYLPENIAHPWSTDQYEKYMYKYAVMRQVVRTGMLNINAASFKIEDVSMIRWNRKQYIKDGKEEKNDTAIIVLKDGKEVETFSVNEYDIIRDIFGENKTGRTYNTALPPKYPYRPNVTDRLQNNP